MAKYGRKDPCYCGSGIKYKRCHGAFNAQDRIGAEMRGLLANMQAAEVQRQRQQGLGRPIISAEMSGGRRIVAVNDRLMHSTKWKTFHDFLGDYIKIALGPEWGNGELAKTSEQRHPILNWYQLVCERQRAVVKIPGEVFDAQMTGAVAAYYHLAYDLYELHHNVELQEKLVVRLRNRGNFEGARYEIFVAAALIRAGFTIEFEDEDDRTTSHCEFTATFTRTGKRFSVEAKHRSGARPRMGRLLIGALRKRANHPRIIFVDVNMPDDGSEVGGSTLMNSAVRKLRGFEDVKVDGVLLPPAYLIVTNTPWHHHLRSTSYRSCADIDGFRIPDFKANLKLPLREAIDARERHREIVELIESMRDHWDIPVTFDGEIPEFAFGGDVPRLKIGGQYLVADADGVERPGRLTTATVNEVEKAAYCALSFADGKSAIYVWPLSDDEMSAWRRHPDTFFGQLTQRSTKARTPLELYDFFFESYKRTPKERLLEFLDKSPDIESLAMLDQAELARVYAERCVYAAMSTTPQANQGDV
ncbi:YecA family protein [Paraburkholderia rhizosphaerae]|uniref:SEC-C motif-containing protein n=1 Tax=Paraburkholderia rhizosphaerae TaxID=480658 RepID=A0A4R8LZ18_9BURK|nr:SEC-C domain-containing protein [Paraburkholderia rhizosphaerae]TDY52719.1 SEC-C motif-containing protein [Paraburkholderia rhizosphaerae]